MGTYTTHKNKNNRDQKHGFKQAMEEFLERLRNGMGEVAEGLRPKEPRLAPIPVPTRGSRRR